MARRSAPVVVGYDGSKFSQAAIRHTAELFPEHPTLVSTVWESDLEAMARGAPETSGETLPPSREPIETLERAESDHASRVVHEGLVLARSFGLEAGVLVVPEPVDIATTLVDLAGTRSAAALVVGSHGISGVGSRVLGSVVQKVIEHSDSDVPVLVVRGKPS
jgi:nucleotide-binding universal stress UspA family protein